MRRVGKAVLVAAFLLAFLPGYLLGAAWEACRAGWRSGRADVKGLGDG